jgi:hypothetical protein
LAGSCEDSDEPSGSIECKEFDYLSVVLASEEELWSMELDM